MDVEGLGMSPQTLIDSLNGNGLVSLTQGQFAALNGKVFDTATRAVDQGMALDMKKINEVASGALENGALSVPAAEGVITVAHGQIRLTNLVTRAEGADLAITGNVDLSEQKLTARMALSGQDASQAAADRPAVSVFVTGPIANPKRTVDVSALTAWLTLRAVELQSKQIEAMEAKRRAAQPPADDPRPVSATPPPPAQTPPSTQAEAPPLPPAIEVPSLPSISEQKPARAPPRAQQRAAPQPRPTPGKPLQLLPASPHD
jgi:large subunit ribosomal protein L24